jgi:hypothetical protein
MNMLVNFPFVGLIVSLMVLWLSVRIGASLRRVRNLERDEREDYGFILTASLTLLALIIGFTFSVALGRYDQRKNYEEAEANAIGTEYVRASLLPAADAARVRTLLRSYLGQRILFYQIRDGNQLRQIDSATAQLETDLWSAVQAPAAAQPNALTGLAVSGMNDVLNSEGYTQAAWLYRIPVEAWGLMGAIAVCCNVLIGYGAHSTKTKGLLFLVLPLLMSISFFLIADIDTPRRGLIRVIPQNLSRLSQDLQR